MAIPTTPFEPNDYQYTPFRDDNFRYNRYDDQILQVTETVDYSAIINYKPEEIKEHVMHRALRSIQELVDKTSNPHEVLAKDVSVEQNASPYHHDHHLVFTIRYDTRHGGNRKHKTYVICGSHSEFEIYVKSKLDEIWSQNTSLSMSDYVYVSDPAHLGGHRNIHGVLYGNWRKRGDIRFLLEVLISRIDSEQSRKKLYEIYSSLNT